MDQLSQAFEDRLQEIEVYLDLLDSLEKQMQGGAPRFSEDGFTVTVQQQRILYSSTYLQLYNLVESTITGCVEAISLAANHRPPNALSTELRREWVRFIARTHIELNYENRLQSAMDLCDHLVQSLPVSAFKVEKGSGGNWDDNAIEKISERLGLSLRVSRSAYQGVKQRFRNDQGALTFIKTLRNDLAHGSVSFAECGEGITVSDLRNLKEVTANYLREVVTFFNSYIEAHEFLLPGRRPIGAE
jgi:MAE_28990/MAE_18760-like HEPN